MSTLWNRADDEWDCKAESRINTAVIECEQPAREEKYKTATLERATAVPSKLERWKAAMCDPPSVPTPMGVPPSLKVTVPPGIPSLGAAAATVAMKLTVWPYTDGLTELLSVVVLLALFTV